MPVHLGPQELAAGPAMSDSVYVFIYLFSPGPGICSLDVVIGAAKVAVKISKDSIEPLLGSSNPVRIQMIAHPSLCIFMQPSEPRVLVWGRSITNNHSTCTVSWSTQEKSERTNGLSGGPENRRRGHPTK